MLKGTRVDTVKYGHGTVVGYEYCKVGMPVVYPHDYVVGSRVAVMLDDPKRWTLSFTSKLSPHPYFYPEELKPLKEPACTAHAMVVGTESL